MNCKVHILTTGGTIGQRSMASGAAAPGFDPRDLAKRLRLGDVGLEFQAVLDKGSKDMAPDDWARLAQATADAITAGADGVVILHGTDTMHYTAAALSFMLQGLGVPVVLTGSMLPGGDVGSDSLPNLYDAIRVAAHADLGEVCIVFSADAARSRGVIIRGNRARKIRSYAIDAFASINVPPIGYVDGGTVARTDLKATPRRRSTLELQSGIEQAVVLVKLTPAMTPPILERQLQGAAGAVLEGTGIGHVKTDLLKVITDFANPVAISTQAVYGGERLGMYESDRFLLEIPNVIPVGDMASDTALVKLMWALTQDDPRLIMQTDIAGEISKSPRTS